MKSFLICPVKGKNPDETRQIVTDLERIGYVVHWPHRDTNQLDNIGLEICEVNRSAIIEAEVVHIVWDGISQGCLFDLGMCFALNKEIHLISIPPATQGKSFQNMMQAWFKRQDPPPHAPPHEMDPRSTGRVPGGACL